MLFPRRFAVLTLVLISTVVCVGYVNGLWTNRWPATFADQEIADMEKLPLEFGSWVGQTVKDEATKQLRNDSTTFLTRQYVNPSDGTVASVMLTRGRPGPLVIKHLPTECYISSGFELVGQVKRYQTQAKVPDDFLVATFKKTTDVSPIIYRVYWSWSATGHWQIPDRPRLAFAKHPVLYKIYVVQALLNENEPLDGAPVHDLIKELTNAMRGTLFPTELQ